MLDDQHRRTEFTPDFLDEWAERFGLSLSDTRSGLVETEHLRPDGEKAGKFDDPTSTCRQITDERVGVAAKPRNEINSSASDR